MRGQSENIRPRLVPRLGAVPAGEQSGGWGESSGVSRKRIKAPGSLLVHHPLLYTGLGMIAQPKPSCAIWGASGCHRSPHMSSRLAPRTE